MRLKINAISIRLNNDAMEAYRYLQTKKVNPAKYLREGGEKRLIEVAEEFKYKKPTKKYFF